jgi:hypothetical protein
VGQELNLHPAILEHSTRCPGSSKGVQPRLEFAHPGDTSSSGVQERLAVL